MGVMKKDRLTSTIVIGIILLLCLATVMFVFFTDINSILPKINQPSSDPSGSSSDVGYVIGTGIQAGVYAAALAVIYFVLLGVCLIPSGICLVFAIRNRKSSSKPIRIVNYVYDGVAVLVMVMAILKFILMVTA